MQTFFLHVEWQLPTAADTPRQVLRSQLIRFNILSALKTVQNIVAIQMNKHEWEKYCLEVFSK